MLTCPTVHPPSTTVADLRRFFADEHVHMTLLVDRGRLIGAVERADLTPALDDETRADSIGTCEGRTVSADADLFGTFAVMKLSGRRRLAVVSDDASLLGLLCLKASGRGFCSDSDVAARQSSQATLT